MFFDDANNHFKGNIVLDSDEIEVLLIKLNKSRKILVTTKFIYFFDKKVTTRIFGQDIDRFDYLELINYEKTIEGKSKITRTLLRFKIHFRVGNYRIVGNNSSSIELSIWKTRFADCLNDCVKALKFVGNKYDAI
ncbi:MAG: hypothetical protein ACJASQ_000997 [Crocinitomicaceae bacterium]|jgi:hypothetical protein